MAMLRMMLGLLVVDAKGILTGAGGGNCGWIKSRTNLADENANPIQNFLSNLNI